MEAFKKGTYFMTFCKGWMGSVKGTKFKKICIENYDNELKEVVSKNKHSH